MRPGMRGGIRVSIRVGIRVMMVQRFGARCYSVYYSELLQYSCGHLCARMVTRMKFQT